LALGFNFYPRSSRCITPERAAEIGAGVDVLKVGVFVNESRARVEEIALVAGLDVAQLHGNETAADQPAVRTWKAFRVDARWDAQALDEFPDAEAFLLDGPLPGSGIAFDWSVARTLSQRIILAGGLAEDTVGRAILEVRPWGVDACSRLERAPGIKDHEKVRRFVRAALAVQL
jgi:phosphoribosylanthranilate isomerase